MTASYFETSRHPITDDLYTRACRDRLDRDGALVVRCFAALDIVDAIVDQSAVLEVHAYDAARTRNAYPSSPDWRFAADHRYNRQIESTKGLVAGDQIPDDSPLREIYNDESFRSFLCGVIGIDQIHPYADHLSSINIHDAASGMELSWHFDNSSFAVEPGTQDLIWCEGATYNMGVEERVPAAWYRMVGSFVLPASGWWNEYCGPIQDRIASLSERLPDNPVASEVAAAAEAEIEMFHRFSDCYSYEEWGRRCGQVGQLGPGRVDRRRGGEPPRHAPGRRPPVCRTRCRSGSSGRRSGQDDE